MHRDLLNRAGCAVNGEAIDEGLACGDHVDVSPVVPSRRTLITAPLAAIDVKSEWCVCETSILTFATTSRKAVLGKSVRRDKEKLAGNVALNIRRLLE